MAGNFPDMRYLFMRGLIEHEIFQRSRHYLKSAAECTSRAIVSLELAEQPVKSARHAARLQCIGGETTLKLTKFQDEMHFDAQEPRSGMYVSSAGSILVSLLNSTEEESSKRVHSPHTTIYIPEPKLKLCAALLSEEKFLPEDDSGLCPAWWRMEILIKRNLVKRRRYKKQPVYSLLPLGKEAAVRLRERNITVTVQHNPFFRETYGLLQHRNPDQNSSQNIIEQSEESSDSPTQSQSETETRCNVEDKRTEYLDFLLAVELAQEEVYQKSSTEVGHNNIGQGNHKYASTEHREDLTLDSDDDLLESSRDLEDELLPSVNNGGGDEEEYIPFPLSKKRRRNTPSTSSCAQSTGEPSCDFSSFLYEEESNRRCVSIYKEQRPLSKSVDSSRQTASQSCHLYDSALPVLKSQVHDQEITGSSNDQSLRYISKESKCLLTNNLHSSRSCWQDDSGTPQRKKYGQVTRGYFTNTSEETEDNSNNEHLQTSHNDDNHDNKEHNEDDNRSMMKIGYHVYSMVT